MPLKSGAKLGPYEIVTPLGAGAMGEVYRARDARLAREVAIKILPREFADSAERRGRFEREARAAAALNHPNILTLFDIGEENGLVYLVTELIEGVSLRERMGRGSIAVKEIYRIAVQIADGLAAAHQGRITHRDLKPENVMVTGEGRVKILDFGLAVQHGEKREAQGPEAPTLLATQPGTVVGTVAYMSPEQARGEQVDYRSDQFSLGVMLYEMVSGELPFVKETAVQTLSAILTDEAKPIEGKVPAVLRWTIARCMEKEAVARYESTRDLHHELRSQLEHLSELAWSGAGVGANEEVGRKLGRWVWVAVGVAGLALWLAGAIFGIGRGGVRLDEYRYTPMEVTLDRPSNPYWSPDGKAFAFSASVKGVWQVYVRYLDQGVPIALTHGAKSAVAAGWSKDSKRVYYWTSRRAGSGESGFHMDLHGVAVTGGDPDLVVRFQALEAPPFLSPDGERVATVQTGADGTPKVHTASPIGSPLRPYEPAPFANKTVINNPSVVFARDGSRMILLWDVEGERQAWSLPLPPGSGAPRRILQEALPAYGATPLWSLFPDSRHAVVSMQGTSERDEQSLYLLDLSSGEKERMTSSITGELAPAVSPDGRHLLVVSGQWHNLLVSLRVESGSIETVIDSTVYTGMPAWARHSDKFVYVSTRNGTYEIWARNSAGEERPVVVPAALPIGTKWLLSPSLSPAGDRVIYVRIDNENRNGLWMSALAGGPPVRLTQGTHGGEFGGSWSPDGSRFTYLLTGEGARKVMQVKTTGDAKPELVRDGVSERIPEWSPNGQWIKFHDPKEGWMLISPDGKNARTIPLPLGASTSFSKDSSRLYGIRKEYEKLFLFSMEIASGQIKDIAEIPAEHRPVFHFSPTDRLSLSPDGKSLLYPATEHTSSIWMLEGFPQPGLWYRLRRLLRH